MHKKGGFKLSVRTLVEIILFVIITLLIALPACSRLFGFWTAKPTSGTTKSIDAIRIQVNNIYEKTDVAVFVDEEHIIKIFGSGDERPEFEGCDEDSDKSCICICTKASCSVEGGEVNMCKSFDDDFFRQSYTIKPKLVDDKAQVQNCVFIKNKIITKVSNEKISLEGCS